MAISEALIEEVSAYLLTKACIELPNDVINLLQKSMAEETNPIAISQFNSILKNVEIAKAQQKPICPDTGVPMFYCNLGSECKLLGDAKAAITRGTIIASDRVPMRHNIMHPLTLENSFNNAGWGIPVIHWDLLVGRDYLELTAIPKGLGGEMHSAHCVVLSSESMRDAICRSVLDVVEECMGEPCPPLVIGVGVGGLVDSVMNLSKRAIFRSPLGTPNPDPAVAEIEKELLAQINSLDLGPMGLGGKRYSLAVNMELNGAHTSEMLLGISIQCWASRYSTARIYDDERAEYITHPKGDGVL